MPPLKGLKLSDVQAVLSAHDLKLGEQIPVDSPHAAQNIVIGSTPKEGTPVKRGATINVKYASGSVTVTSVKGDTCAKATAVLQKLTFKPTCQQQHNASVPNGEAFATNPPEGTTIRQNSPITVYISSGASQVPLPSVVSETAGQAKHDLAAAGFVVSVIQQVVCDPGQNNIVQKQSPDGPTAPRGSTVTITVDKFRPSDPTCTGGPGST